MKIICDDDCGEHRSEIDVDIGSIHILFLPFPLARIVIDHYVIIEVDLLDIDVFIIVVITRLFSFLSCHFFIRLLFVRL